MTRRLDWEKASELDLVREHGTLYAWLKPALDLTLPRAPVKGENQCSCIRQPEIVIKKKMTRDAIIRKKQVDAHLKRKRARKRRGPMAY
jgi:hypothetical protein